MWCPVYLQIRIEPENVKVLPFVVLSFSPSWAGNCCLREDWCWTAMEARQKAMQALADGFEDVYAFSVRHAHEPDGLSPYVRGNRMPMQRAFPLVEEV